VLHPFAFVLASGWGLRKFQDFAVVESSFAFPWFRKRDIIGPVSCAGHVWRRYDLNKQQLDGEKENYVDSQGYPFVANACAGQLSVFNFGRSSDP
jgi:hypothetical protein